MTINDNDTHLNRIAREHADRANEHREFALRELSLAPSADSIWVGLRAQRAQAYATLALAEWTAARAETRR